MASRVDLVIPAFNEEENIPALFEAIQAATHTASRGGEGQPWLRWVVLGNNASTDRTAELAEAEGAVVVHESQRGYGAACLAAIREIERRVAEGEPPPTAVAFLDADLADDPAQLPGICQPVFDGEADLVIASRRKQAEPGSLTFVQHIGNAFACNLIRLFAGKRFSDLGPMRVVRWESLQAMAMEDRTWGWTVEMQFKAAKLGLRCHEIDVPYRCRRAGKSKISGTIMGSVKAGYKITTTIFKLWWKMRRSSNLKSES